MVKRERINELYFKWLCELVCDKHRGKYFGRLLETLHMREFTWLMNLDADRASDGVSMREKFAYYHNLELDIVLEELEGPCSVLEMMVGLAYRVENQIMGEVGDEDVGRWFWNMVDNMYLGNMDNGNYDELYVQQSIDILLDRNYQRNGSGGLYLIADSDRDAREMTIWAQMCHYLNDFE